MIELEVGQLPEHLATVLMLRGGGVPRLTWATGPCQAAKELLERVDSDRDLLGTSRLIDEGAASTVRALMFLWSGWLADAEMCAQVAPEQERLMLTSLCRRHDGKPDDAKIILQQIGDHPVFADLAAYAAKAIEDQAAPLLLRLRGMVEMTDVWEPFTFVDVLERARAGKLDTAGEMTVRCIQCREFELLLARSYEAATGLPVQRPVEETPVVTPRPHAKPVSARSRDAVGRSRHPAPKATQSAADANATTKGLGTLRRPTNAIGIRCPKCTYVCSFPPTARGTVQPCRKCGTQFLVPAAK